jgi:hypothetical protein
MTDAASYVLRFINRTNRSIFLTGKAGTGKTTLLREIIRTTHKNTVVVAPTGIAALNAGGVTIHSMFQLPFAAFIPEKSAGASFSPTVRFESRDTLRRHFKVSSQKQAVIRSMELLVIDEVSMLRADLLDAVDFMLQSIRKNIRPFGGVQVLYIGDLMQLPPVVKNEEWSVLKKYYKGAFFFHSHAVQRQAPLYIELSTIFRQSDDRFIGILNNLRNNTISYSDVLSLNDFVRPEFVPPPDEGYITLTTHNAKADAINTQSLAALSGAVFRYYPEIVDDFPEKIYPVDEVLGLKVGAQIMFVKNDPSTEKAYFNGKTGIISSLSEQEIMVHFPLENKTIEVERYEWKNIRYTVNDTTKDIEEELLGTFVHYPIKLAWAITVHKSQGLTFDKAILDVSQVFLPGQAYVALSRMRSLEGLVLREPLRMNSISNDVDVVAYAQTKPDIHKLSAELEAEQQRFIKDYLQSGYDFIPLSQEWRNYRFEHGDKLDHKDWAGRQSLKLEVLMEPAQKFRAQIERLFSKPPDLAHVQSRVDAANDYFFLTLDQMLEDLLWKFEETRRKKKTKALQEALVTLIDFQHKAVTGLLRAKRLIDTVVSGGEISRETMFSPDIKSYFERKREKVRGKYLEQNATLVEDDIVYDLPVKGKKKKEPKKSTVEETYELWLQNHTIRDISKIRKLTPQTISNHLAKLIENARVQIEDVLPPDKIAELVEIFDGYGESSLNPLKEQYGNRFTWDDLKLFRASLNQASK